MRALAKDLVYLLIIAALFAVFMYSPARKWAFGIMGIEAETRPVMLRDTVYVDRPYRGPGETAEPEYITIYRDTTIYIDRIVEIPVPASMPEIVIAAPEPLEVKPGEVVFHYWEPNQGRFESAFYTVPERPFEAYVDTFLGTFPKATLGLEIGARYKRVGAFIAAGSNADGEGIFLGGVSLRISRYTR